MELVELGEIVRLQVQRSSLKQGPARGVFYNPEPILSVDRLAFDEHGATAMDADGGVILDVHNALHPQTKNRGENGLSFGFTSHYVSMRERFGAHLSDGIAGENVLIARDARVELPEVIAGVVISGADERRLTLSEVCVAVPCAEFSRFCLDNLEAPARELTSVLQFLNHGTRGYYATADVPAGAALDVHVGDRVYAIVPQAPVVEQVR